jgi:signal transduction histidine kinase
VGDLVADQVRGDEWGGTRVELDLDDAQVAADSQLLECVVVNLLANAAAYNRDGGEVRVAVGADPDDPATALLAVANLARPADVAAVQAALSGEIETFRGSAHGHGIGLTVVALIVDALRGTVRTTGPAGCVRIEVRLPMSLRSEPEATSPLAGG